LRIKKISIVTSIDFFSNSSSFTIFYVKFRIASGSNIFGPEL
jgi:hypothetical protein